MTSFAGEGAANSPVGGSSVRVAVVSWNTRDLLRRCLDSLFACVQRGQAEVVVVDNASVDGSAEEVIDRFPWATLIRAERNLGFGAAVNRAVAGAETDWLVAANADTELTEGALEHLLSTGRSDPRIAVVAPRLELPDRSIQDSVYAYPRLSATIAANLGLHHVNRRVADWIRYGHSWDPSRESEIEWAMGAFLLLRRVAFESVGGFDAVQWMYAEDLDLCWRLRRRGWTVWYAPGATVRHVGGAAASLAFDDHLGTREVVRAYYRWLRRRRGMAVTWLVGAVTLAGGFVRVGAYAVLGGLGFGWAADARRRACTWTRLNVESLRGGAGPLAR